MKLIAPDYYQSFACIAERCRHSCCKGWEIDIDGDTLAMYKRFPGPWGEKLRENIDFEAETACFRLRGDERCPFLQDDGLCELILNIGEGMLCQICSDHPRYRFDYRDRTEIGLGLCCEAAAELILSWEPPVCFALLEQDGSGEEEDPEETAFFIWRESVFQIAQNRALSIQERVGQIIRQEKLGPITEPFGDADFLLSLERMDEAWAEKLKELSAEAPELSDTWEVPLEQLLMYLLYRHLPASLDDGERKGRLKFVVYCWRMCASLLRQHPEMESFFEIARLFSSEIEYSDENVEKIIRKLG